MAVAPQISASVGQNTGTATERLSRVMVRHATHAGSIRRSTGISRMRATSPSAGLSAGRVDTAATMGWSRKPLMWMSIGVSGAQRSHGCRLEADLLVGLAQRRLFERLPRFDDAAGQGDLAAVPFERAGANSQHDIGAVLGREEQQEPRCLANPRVVELVTATHGAAAASCDVAPVRREAVRSAPVRGARQYRQTSRESCIRSAKQPAGPRGAALMG